MPDKLDASAFVTAVIPISEPASELILLQEWVKKLDSRVHLVFVVDALYEDSLFLAKKLASSTKSISVIEVESLGPGSAREAGREECQTEYLTFWDCDDLPYIDEIIKEIVKMHRSTDVLVGKYDKYDHVSHRVINARTGQTSHFSTLHTPGIWRMVFRTKSISNIHFPSLRMAEDHLFFAQIAISDLRIVYTDSILYRYTSGRTKQLSNNQAALSELPLALKEINKILDSRDLTRNKRQDLYFVFLNLTISYAKREKDLQTTLKLVNSIRFRGIFQLIDLLLALMKVLLVKVQRK